MHCLDREIEARVMERMAVGVDGFDLRALKAGHVEAARIMTGIDHKHDDTIMGTLVRFTRSVSAQFKGTEAQLLRHFAFAAYGLGNDDCKALYMEVKAIAERPALTIEDSYIARSVLVGLACTPDLKDYAANKVLVRDNLRAAHNADSAIMAQATHRAALGMPRTMHGD